MKRILIGILACCLLVALSASAPPAATKQSTKHVKVVSGRAAKEHKKTKTIKPTPHVFRTPLRTVGGYVPVSDPQTNWSLKYHKPPKGKAKPHQLLNPIGPFKAGTPFSGTLALFDWYKQGNSADLDVFWVASFAPVKDLAQFGMPAAIQNLTWTEINIDPLPKPDPTDPAWVTWTCPNGIPNKGEFWLSITVFHYDKSNSTNALQAGSSCIYKVHIN